MTAWNFFGLVLSYSLQILKKETMSLVNLIMYTLIISGVIALGATVYTYAKGLKKSPRDLWLLFIYKIVEYAAYSAMNLALILWLSKDCGLGDIAAGS